VGKTGGGPGTNQYKVRGQSKATEHLVYGYPPDQVIKRGKCVWLRTGFDDIWCLKHRQLAPELRELMQVVPCIITLGPQLQEQLADLLPSSVFGPWVGQASSVAMRRVAARHMPVDQLQWAITDEDWQVRYVAAQRMPVGQLQWATKDPDEDVRQVAAERMPVDQLQWATRDDHWRVRRAVARRMPVDQLSWATEDPDEDVRYVAAKRMPEDQLQWAAQDKHRKVRRVAVRRMPVQQLDWAINDPDEDVCQAAAQRRAGRAPKPLPPAAPRIRWVGSQ
jgi:hypothetical protein